MEFGENGKFFGRFSLTYPTPSTNIPNSKCLHCVEGNFGHAIWHDTLQLGVREQSADLSLCPIVTNYCSTANIIHSSGDAFFLNLLFPGKLETRAGMAHASGSMDHI